MKSMERGESLAILALILILVGLPAAALGYQSVLRPALAEVRTIDIVAAAPEAGGFQPDAVRIAAGETVRLRFSVPDVTHGIAFGPGLDLDLGHVDPGEVQEVEVTFDEPGRFTFYCNSWCSPNHWRMRGTIEVYDPVNPDTLIVHETEDPILEALIVGEVDIDASHEAVAVPTEMPSALRGAEVVRRLGEGLPSDLPDTAWRRGHSPVEAWSLLTGLGLDEIAAWDAVAYLWLNDLDASRLETATLLYAKNCAACHGESGDGHGPGADALDAQGLTAANVMATSGAPAAFSDARTMLGGTGEVYYAKLRRGGMGTGMPGFGPIFTIEESWALVDYLWSFVFEQ
jgi:plastocyanin/mono/diheme cytochrome c family protein